MKKQNLKSKSPEKVEVEKPFIVLSNDEKVLRLKKIMGDYPENHLQCKKIENQINKIRSNF